MMERSVSIIISFFFSSFWCVDHVAVYLNSSSFFLCVRFYMCREKKRGRIGFATDLRKGQQKQQREKHMFDRRSDRK